MADDPFSDPRLVGLYDRDNPGGADHDFYRALADEIAAGTIVDLGCGTGMLTVTLADHDRTVIGVDPSPTMLDFARRRSGAAAVTWVDGDASVIDSALGEQRADLIIMSGNTAQHILGADWSATLEQVRDGLRPGGLLAFESRNPDNRAWEDWTEERTIGSRDTPVGRMTEWLELISVTTEEVTFDAHNLFEVTGEDAVYRSTLAFRTAQELTADLAVAGLTVRSITGGWSQEPVTPASRIYVVTAVRE
ncbi:methyltransferase [Microlunatus endophyticus]|uniref:Methyltransferase n=1 Tax=Microlunatus endophyticus TaxID=1716077 RepID=A0A917S7A7_9ACTN|nr:class I SAM-dependent methyltransferase [Microlunatus endophyticus]GGL59253.1 methyltransferase [Microlunatus endophyticus]